LILAEHLASLSDVNPEPRSRPPDQFVTGVLVIGVATGRDRARSGVDAVQAR
jgi:hypothetical protein